MLSATWYSLTNAAFHDGPGADYIVLDHDPAFEAVRSGSRLYHRGPWRLPDRTFTGWLTRAFVRLGHDHSFVPMTSA
jgi:hypothetical protein